MSGQNVQRRNGMKRKSTETRQTEIVDAAMHIIATKGTKKFTAQLVANEIGVTPGAIFRHFGSMDEIVDAVIDRMESLLFEGFPPTAEDPLERLGVFFRRRVQAIAEHADVSRLLLSDHMAHVGGEKSAARIKELKKRTQKFVRQCLRQAADAGEMSDEIGVEAASMVVMGSVLAIGHSTPGAASKKAIRELSDEIWRALETMLRPPPEGASRSKKGRSR
jgi:AcrR family transcriptional regulator